MNSRRHCWLLLLCCLTIFGVPTHACDDPPEERVKITVVVILAHSREEKVHPKLTCIARELQKKHPKLTAFRMGENTAKSVVLGKSEVFPLAEDQEATVFVKRCTEDPDRYCLKVKSPTLVGCITYSAVCGKCMPFDTGHTTAKEGDRVFLAVMVEPCKKK